jgi:hypothetical protein
MRAATCEQYSPKRIVARSVDGFIYARWRMRIPKTKKPLPRIVSREGLVEVQYLSTEPTLLFFADRSVESIRGR